MHPIEQTLLSTINKHPQTPLVIAYSGGVDSQVLLHVLAKLKHARRINNQVTVCHVNHGLSDNAQQWQDFAQQQCLRLKLYLQVCQVNVQVQAQQSLEALARDARYQALQSIHKDSSIIITGHHRDDQAETFLLALKRGSGLKGLSAMAAQSKLHKDCLVRPLLGVSRYDIVNYAKAHNLVWVEDESNQDTQFDRNFIRHDIMPLLNKRWPSITRTINRSSEHCFEGQLLLDELAAEDLLSCIKDENNLSVAALIKLSLARFNNLIRYFLSQNNCLMPSTEQLVQLHQQLTANDDKNPVVKVGEHFLRRYKGDLYLTGNYNDISSWHVDVDLSSSKAVSIVLPDNIGELNFSVVQYKNIVNMQFSQSKAMPLQKAALAKPEQKVTVRFSHNNPRCLPDYRQHSRPLKKVLQELNIPPWQRKRIPFLYYDDILVAALGCFVCQNFKSSSTLL